MLDRTASTHCIGDNTMLAHLLHMPFSELTALKLAWALCFQNQGAGPLGRDDDKLRGREAPGVPRARRPAGVGRQVRRLGRRAPGPDVAPRRAESRVAATPRRAISASGSTAAASSDIWVLLSAFIQICSRISAYVVSIYQIRACWILRITGLECIRSTRSCKLAHACSRLLAK